MNLWTRYRVAIIDGFVIANLAFLSVDIYFAHSINEFHETAEWIPFMFSLVAPPLLVLCLFLHAKGILKRTTNAIVEAIAYLAIAVGIIGLILHLKSQFFIKMNIKSLVYTAPFIAPLSYSGLGFLLLLNRKVSAQTKEWGQWIIFFALGGFFGNFVLSLCDHAQNGFYRVTEWIPVYMSAFAVGFLMVTLLTRPTSVLLKVTFAVLIAQIFVGLLGIYLHLKINVVEGPGSIFENFVYGAPVFAPLLFADIAILGMLGVFDLKLKLRLDA